MASFLYNTDSRLRGTIYIHIALGQAAPIPGHCHGSDSHWAVHKQCTHHHQPQSCQQPLPSQSCNSPNNGGEQHCSIRHLGTHGAKAYTTVSPDNILGCLVSPFRCLYGWQLSSPNAFTELRQSPFACFLCLGQISIPHPQAPFLHNTTNSASCDVFRLCSSQSSAPLLPILHFIALLVQRPHRQQPKTGDA